MLRVGLIGCGGIVQRTHALGYKALAGRLQVTALADVSAANLDEAGGISEVPPAQWRSSERRPTTDDRRPTGRVGVWACGRVGETDDGRPTNDGGRTTGDGQPGGRAGRQVAVGRERGSREE